ncbi:LuxR C-terminal-related transcriptional regulator, partial [Desulfocurvibacter africanus]
LAGGLAVWDALGLEGGSMAEVLRYYPSEQAHEIHAPESGPQGEERYFELKIIPLSLVSLASRGYILVLNDITAHVRQRDRLEQVVAERTEALRAEKTQLQEMNITLRHVMSSVEKERESDRHAIAHIVETVLLPALERVRRESAAEVRKGYLDILGDQLVKLAPGVGPDGDARLLKLTPMEMKICRFIRAGSSSKDIAEAMNLSSGTIQTHRKNIRKKLALQGQDINLYTYLQSLAPSAS